MNKIFHYQQTLNLYESTTISAECDVMLIINMRNFRFVTTFVFRDYHDLQKIN